MISYSADGILNLIWACAKNYSHTSNNENYANFSHEEIAEENEKATTVANFIFSLT